MFDEGVNRFYEVIASRLARPVNVNLFSLRWMQDGHILSKS